jgi:3-methyladenine DNA glycosylase AlkD
MTETIDPAREAAILSGALRRLSSNEVDPTPIITTSLPFYGVRLADLRSMAGRWHREHPGAGGREIAAVAGALWAKEIREEMVLAALIHGRDAESRRYFGLRTLDRWAATIDNWETADALGMSVLAPWVADRPDRGFRTLEQLARRRNPWARRLALVGCLGTGRSTEAATWWPAVERLVLRLSSDKEGGIPKAISWVLRIHTHHCPGEVEPFLTRHAGDLPAIAVRETRNKLATGTKSGRRSS